MKYVRNAAFGLVALVAAVVSYHHQVKVATIVGEDRFVAWILPLSVDGLMVVASMAMFTDKKAGQPVRWSARLAFGLGIAASVTANIAAAQPTAGARLVASWPAVALLMTVELLARAPKAETVEEETEEEPAVVKERQPSKRKAQPKAAVRQERARALKGTMSYEEIAKQLGVSLSTVNRDLREPSPNGHEPVGEMR